MATVYKVVRVKSLLLDPMLPADAYTSASISRRHGGVVYHIGMKTVPKIPRAPLMAFRDLKDALEFVDMWKPERGTLAVLKCQAEISRTKPVQLVDIDGGVPLTRVDLCWTRKVPGRCFCPQGTVLCRSITPTKRLEPIQPYGSPSFVTSS